MIHRATTAIACAFLFTSLPSSAALIFSEIMYDPASDPDNDWEWIELYNSGHSAIDLSGYVIDDINSNTVAAPNIVAGAIAAMSTGILYDAHASRSFASSVRIVDVL